MNVHKARTLVDLACQSLVSAPHRGVRHLLVAARDMLRHLPLCRNVWRGHGRRNVAGRLRDREAQLHSMARHASLEALDMRAALLRASRHVRQCSPQGHAVVPHIHVGATVAFFSPRYAQDGDPYLELPLSVDALRDSGHGPWWRRLWPQSAGDVGDALLAASEVWLSLHAVLMLELPLVPDTRGCTGAEFISQLVLPATQHRARGGASARFAAVPPPAQPDGLPQAALPANLSGQA